MVTVLISIRLLASDARQFLFSMGQSGALVVVAFAVVVVALAVVALVVVALVVVVALAVVVSDPPPPPIGIQASDCRTAAMASKAVLRYMFMTLAKVMSAKSDLFFHTLFFYTKEKQVQMCHFSIKVFNIPILLA